MTVDLTASGSPGADIAVRVGRTILGTATLNDEGRGSLTVRANVVSVLLWQFAISYTANGVYGPWMAFDVFAS